MARPILTDFDFQNISRVRNLPNGTLAQDAATVAQLNAAVEGLSSKPSARAASTGNVNLTSPGTTLDGITLVSGVDRILLKDQTTASQNGIYLFNGASTALTRVADANTGQELTGAIIVVTEGTANSGTSWRQTSVNITLETTNIAWTPYGTVSPPASTTTPGVAALATQSEANAGTVTNKIITPQTLAAFTGFPKKVAGTIGDGSATQFDVNHNLNTADILVQVYRVASPYDVVEADMLHLSVNSVRIVFASAPASGAYRVVVLG